MRIKWSVYYHDGRLRETFIESIPDGKGYTLGTSDQYIVHGIGETIRRMMIGGGVGKIVIEPETD